jgi:hypothetical protein
MRATMTSVGDKYRLPSASSEAFRALTEKASDIRAKINDRLMAVGYPIVSARVLMLWRVGDQTPAAPYAKTIEALWPHITEAGWQDKLQVIEPSEPEPIQIQAAPEQEDPEDAVTWLLIQGREIRQARQAALQSGNMRDYKAMVDAERKTVAELGKLRAESAIAQRKVWDLPYVRAVLDCCFDELKSVPGAHERVLEHMKAVK